MVLDGRHRADVNGIEVRKADGVWLENLTVHNFDRRGKDGENGNGIWWNGGDGSGRIGMHGRAGAPADDAASCRGVPRNPLWG